MTSEKEKKEVENKKSIRYKKGVVVSDKMDKTILVEVITFKTHKKYFKKYKDSKKYKVHDEKNIYKVGEEVKFVECHPISRDKKWKVMEGKKSVE